MEPNILSIENSVNPDKLASSECYKFVYTCPRTSRQVNCSMFVCFVALHPKSTAVVMAGWSVHLTILFLGKLEQAVNQYFVHILSLVTDNNPS